MAIQWQADPVALVVKLEKHILTEIADYFICSLNKLFS